MSVSMDLPYVTGSGEVWQACKRVRKDISCPSLPASLFFMQPKHAMHKKSEEYIYVILFTQRKDRPQTEEERKTDTYT